MWPQWLQVPSSSFWFLKPVNFLFWDLCEIPTLVFWISGIPATRHLLAWARAFWIGGAQAERAQGQLGQCGAADVARRSSDTADFAVEGGLASTGLGRPESIHSGSMGLC